MMTEGLQEIGGRTYMEIKVNPEVLQTFAERIQHSHSQTADALQKLSWEATNLHFLSVADIDKVLDLQEELQHMIRKLDSLTENAHLLVKDTAEQMRKADEELEGSSGWTEFWSSVWSDGGTHSQDTWNDIKNLKEWNTYDNMHRTIEKPLGTLNVMWNSLSMSWEEKVVNGSTCSRTEFFTYGVIQMGLGILSQEMNPSNIMFSDSTEEVKRE